MAIKRVKKAGRPSEQIDTIIHILRQIERFKTCDQLTILARRLFQKDPEIIKISEERLEGVAISQRRSFTRQYIVAIIEAAIKKETRGIPEKAESYASFCDLTWTFQNSVKKMWYTFVLQDYPDDISGLHDPESGTAPLVKMRKLLKSQLRNGGSDVLTSVQMDFKAGEDIDMAFFRIVTIVKNSKNTKNEVYEKRLLFGKPTYLAYFPGEPYFFAHSKVPDPDHCQAFVNVLSCSSYAGLPLSGRHIDSLRQLRVNRDKVDCGGHSVVSWHKSDEELPILNNYALSSTADVSLESDDELTLKSSAEIKGRDVFDGLRQFDVLTSPLPFWAKHATSRARNEINLEAKSDRRSRISKNTL